MRNLVQSLIRRRGTINNTSYKICGKIGAIKTHFETLTTGYYLYRYSPIITQITSGVPIAYLPNMAKEGVKFAMPENYLLYRPSPVV